MRFRAEELEQAVLKLKEQLRTAVSYLLDAIVGQTVRLVGFAQDVT